MWDAEDRANTGHSVKVARSIPGNTPVDDLTAGETALTAQEMHMTDTTKDLAFAKTPLDWPKYPVLPLVHHDRNDLRCGFIFAGDTFAGDTAEPTVYLHTIFGLGAGKQWKDVLEPLPKLKYKSLEEVFKEWRVD